MRMPLLMGQKIILCWIRGNACVLNHITFLYSWITLSISERQRQDGVQRMVLWLIVDETALTVNANDESDSKSNPCMMLTWALLNSRGCNTNVERKCISTWYFDRYLRHEALVDFDRCLGHTSLKLSWNCLFALENASLFDWDCFTGGWFAL